jgi:hypothetical protein
VAVLAVVIVILELLSFLPGGLAASQSRSSGTPAPSAASAGGTDGAASTQLSGAESSLQSGGGPADGSPLSCSGVLSTETGIACGAPSPPTPLKPLVTTTPTWSYAKQPPVRGEFSIAYDVRDKYVLLFAGVGSGSKVLGDTWKYAGGLWTQLHPAVSPPARYAAAMAFDGVDNYVLLYGGYSGSAGLTDTWKFAGGAWTKLTPTTNPGALIYASMTYDAKDLYVVYFGGLTTAFVAKGNTWEFKAGQWSQLTPSPAPPARYYASFDYDPAAGYAVLFGGNNVTFHEIGDTWNFSGGHWTKLTPSVSPSARAQAAMAYSAKNGELVLFSGFTGSVYLSDTWTFISGVWTKISTTTHPSSRYTEMADGTNSTSVTLFGGSNPKSVLLNDTWTFAGVVWTHALPRAPTIRDFTVMTYDEADGYVLLFGGASSGTIGDSWKFVHGIWTPLHPSVSPPARAGASMVYDAADGYVVLFGGQSKSVPEFNDTWTYVGGVWTQVISGSAVPAARVFASMTYDYADGYVLLFGGFNFSLGQFSYSDTWTFSAGVWTNVTIGSGPSARYLSQIAYDSEDGYVVLFSGESRAGGPFYSYPDTWTYSDYVWTNITGTLTLSPQGRDGGSMVDDTYDGYLLLFGGFNATNGALADTWSFVNGEWSELSPAVSPPQQSAGFGMAFDPPDNEVVLLGTTSLTPVTWTY